jgi:hypothetical protein
VEEKKTPKTGKPERDDAHASRVEEAFASFLGKHGERLDEPGQGLLDGMREAAARKDRERLRAHLAEARESHGWLYRELAAHPQLATLLDELALWGF